MILCICQLFRTNFKAEASDVDLLSLECQLSSQFTPLVPVNLMRLVSSLISACSTSARQLSFAQTLRKMSQYTTVEKGAPDSTNFRIFYRKCDVSAALRLCCPYTRYLIGSNSLPIN